MESCAACSDQCFRGHCVLDEQGQLPVRLIRESSKMLVAPIPFDAERNLFERLLLQRVEVAREPFGFFAAEVHLELRYPVEGTYIVPCAPWPIVDVCLSQFQAQCRFKSG